MVRRGRRPAGSGTRDAIIEEARRQFGERGYPATTLRSVATGAGVDAKLVLHYFGSKQGLFAQSVELPLAPDTILERVFSGGPEGIAERAAGLVLAAMEDERGRRAFTAMLRAAVSEPEAAEALRDVLTTRLLMPIAERVGGRSSGPAREPHGQPGRGPRHGPSHRGHPGIGRSLTRAADAGPGPRDRSLPA